MWRGTTTEHPRKTHNVGFFFFTRLAELLFLRPFVEGWRATLSRNHGWLRTTHSALFVLTTASRSATFSALFKIKSCLPQQTGKPRSVAEKERKKKLVKIWTPFSIGASVCKGEQTLLKRNENQVVCQLKKKKKTGFWPMSVGCVQFQSSSFLRIH